mmetsp:Transcript_93515/g.291035  ORF Transcript_93515/g.291035 Transcript_93515/m.291035 type:complete len:242 (-) Transcript_93515:3-728(-)
MHGHARRLELQRAEGALRVGLHGGVAEDPALRPAGGHVEHHGELVDLEQVAHLGHHEDEAGRQAAVVVLHAVLARVHLLHDLVLVTGHDPDQGVPHEGPQGPDVVGVEPGGRVLRAPRAEAAGPVRALVEAHGEVAEVHLAAQDVHDLRRLADEDDRGRLQQVVQAEQQEGAGGQHAHRPAPVHAARDLRDADEGAVDGVHLELQRARELHLRELHGGRVDDVLPVARPLQGLIAGLPEAA